MDFPIRGWCSSYSNEHSVPSAGLCASPDQGVWRFISYKIPLGKPDPVINNSNPNFVANCKARVLPGECELALQLKCGDSAGQGCWREEKWHWRSRRDLWAEISWGKTDGKKKEDAKGREAQEVGESLLRFKKNYPKVSNICVLIKLYHPALHTTFRWS